VAMADLRPEMVAHPLAEPNFRWQDLADDYLTHVLDAVVRWGMTSDQRRDSATSTRGSTLRASQSQNRIAAKRRWSQGGTEAGGSGRVRASEPG
jgi:hypothetical protein